MEHNISNLMESLKGVLVSFVHILETRFKLLGVELAEEKARILGLLIMATFLVFFSCLTFVAVLLMIIAIYWDTSYRIEATVGIVLALLSLSIGLGLMLWKKLKMGPIFFEASLQELRKDREILKSS